MAKVVAPVTARVEVIGKPKESSFEPGKFYYPTLFVDLAQPEGSEQSKIWKNLSGDEISQLKKGDRVQLVPAGKDKSGKDKHNIVVMEGSTAPMPPNRPAQLPPASSTTLNPDQKRAIAGFIDQQGDLLKFCWATAKAKLSDVAGDEESIRCAATTLFLSASRKFGLDR